jgi:broad specificity phosphatase PhoE
MTTFLLVRHCAVNALGHYLAGRAPDEHLNEAGRAQARVLAHRFSGVALDAVFSSPLERACETAAALAACCKSGVQTVNALLELNYGDWTNKTFTELEHDPRWSRFNSRRSTTRIPGGETLLEVQARAVGFVGQVAECLPQGRVALVTHGDVIRAMICFFLNIPIDCMQRFEIDPGSVSVLELGDSGPVLRGMNAGDFDPRRAIGTE